VSQLRDTSDFLLLIGAAGLTTSIPAGVLITERLIMAMVISPEMASFTAKGKANQLHAFSFRRH
jgi:hypothetical protein